MRGRLTAPLHKNDEEHRRLEELYDCSLISRTIGSSWATMPATFSTMPLGPLRWAVPTSLRLIVVKIATYGRRIAPIDRNRLAVVALPTRSSKR